jgi:aspartate ammonia-lyase
MPARKKPVIILDNPIKKTCSAKKRVRFEIAPAIAHMKKTFEGENRSEIVKMAKSKVPAINPNCTAEVMFPKAVETVVVWATISNNTALPANHNEVQANCAITIMGRTHDLWLLDFNKPVLK